LATAEADSGKNLPRGWASWPLLMRLCHREGRSAAAALLALIALLYIAAGEWFWSPARNLVFDAYQRTMPRAVARFPAVIIDIDDRSLADFGRWPWPRTRLAELVGATHRLGALAVGIDIIMPEADQLSPNYLLAGRPDLAPALRDALALLPSNDAILASALRQAPAVIARAALAGKTKTAGVAAQTPVIIVGESPLPYLHSFPAELLNVAEIESAASGRGYVNDTRDRDGAVRVMPLVIAVGEAPAPALALEILRVATGEKQYSIRSDRNGVVGVQIGDSFIRTDADGRLRPYFSPAYAAPRVSAAAILKGEVKANALANQVAIIGATAVGVADVAATPTSSRMDGVEIQVQLVENILAGSRLRRPPSARWWELLSLVALALPLIVYVSRLRPVHALMLFVAGTALPAVVSLLLFKQFHFLYDPTFPAAGSTLVVLLLLFAGFAASERRRRELDAALEEERTERLRAAGELRAARDIQMGMLPNPRRIEGLPPALDFFALLEPAQEVGGDMYDAFMIDPHRLCFMIGDVSGKGVPASLFMALTKTLSKSVARRERAPLDQLLRLVNDEISRENAAEMFVTAIFGIIDARSGEVELCNAGHNAPILLRTAEPPQELDGASGPPLCVDETFPYTTQRLKLESGNILLFITDGVTEAENERQARYGTARAIACVAGEQITDAAAVCAKLLADVKTFAAGAPPYDDLTIVAVRFLGSQE
jgi:serine phosphatase RsbU (regulator of sigma subunit)/CHASE2 domain-containing sensor protein